MSSGMSRSDKKLLIRHIEGVNIMTALKTLRQLQQELLEQFRISGDKEIYRKLKRISTIIKTKILVDMVRHV